MTSHLKLAGIGLSLLIASPALAAGFEAQLDPAPFDASNRAVVIGGAGKVAASLDGDTLKIRGDFSGLSAPATAASLRMGAAKGVPGEAIGSLAIDHVRAGGFSGLLKLSAAQIAAMRRQALYIRIDSEQAPDGTLQGWLEGAN